MNMMISLRRLFVIFIFCISFSLHADFSDRMKSRLADVIAAKDSGSLGEGVDGFLHLRKQDDPNAKKLMDSENADRKSLFQALAQNGGE